MRLGRAEVGGEMKELSMLMMRLKFADSDDLRVNSDRMR